MKIDEAIKRWQSGERLLFGEYRASKAEVIKYRDKTTRAITSMSVLRHTVEVGPDSVVVNERVEDDFDAEHYKSPFAKGQKVIVHLDSLVIEKGIPQARGKITAISG
jgi:hypothetical protein